MFLIDRVDDVYESPSYSCFRHCMIGEVPLIAYIHTN